MMISATKFARSQLGYAAFAVHENYHVFDLYCLLNSLHMHVPGLAGKSWNGILEEDDSYHQALLPSWEYINTSQYIQLDMVEVKIMDSLEPIMLFNYQRKKKTTNGEIRSLKYMKMMSS